MIHVSASVMYNRPIEGGNWQTTIAWGRNKRERTFLTYQPPTTGTTHIHFLPGEFGVSPVLTQNAFLAETGMRFRERHSLFTRMEWAEKDELSVYRDTVGRKARRVLVETRRQIGHGGAIARKGQDPDVARLHFRVDVIGEREAVRGPGLRLLSQLPAHQRFRLPASVRRLCMNGPPAP